MYNNKTSLKTYRYTVLAMRLLEKLLGSKIKVEGLENIPQKPVLFVANHFTRSETFVVPYIIYRHTKRQVRCLADSGLFHGVLGRFLKSVGALSTKDKRRDLAIVSDLLNGDYDWMIYPEGSMIKSKSIYNDGRFIYTPGTSGRVRTGSAVLALKSELYRNEIIAARKAKKMEVIEYYRNLLQSDINQDIEKLDTNIVPVNITYYPIRPGKNTIYNIAHKLLKKIPKSIAEELEIEGNLLLSSNINISFGQAINLSNYVKKTQKMIYQIPIIKSETKANLVLKYLKNTLTNQFMAAIYLNTKINLDHLFVAVIYFYEKNQITLNDLKNLIYLSARNIYSLKKYRLNQFINIDQIHKILTEEKHPQFNDILNLAIDLNILKKTEIADIYEINKEKLKQKFDFHQIRIENTLQVILNEFLILDSAVDAVKRNSSFKEDEIRQKCFNYLFSLDLENYDEDYKKYYDQEFSKNKSVGLPFFFENPACSKKANKKNKKGCKVGIVMIHGYLSAPKEMEEMARYFNDLGFRIYGVRLKGHGTSPINLEDVKWQDWHESVKYGYQSLKMICDKVFIIGFSTGGLLSLVTALEKENKIDGVVCINPALKLKDIRTKFSSGVYLWNDILEKLNVKKGQLRYVENTPEFPDINYSRNYVKGIEQLEKLMTYCEDNLKKFSTPILLLQSSNDPVVNPKSSRIIFDKISSKNKDLQEIKSDKHIIVKDKNALDLFKIIASFLNKLLVK